MTNLVKKLFGDPGNDEAIERQEKSNELLREFIANQTNMARADIRNTLPSMQQAMTAGTQAGMDIYEQTMPQQMQAMTGGNVAAQEAILAGMPMFEQAYRGGAIDYTALKPYEGSIDMSFASQQLPEAVANPEYIAMEAGRVDPTSPYISPKFQNMQSQMLHNPNVAVTQGLGGQQMPDDIDYAGFAEYQAKTGRYG